MIIFITIDSNKIDQNEKKNNGIVRILSFLQIQSIKSIRFKIVIAKFIQDCKIKIALICLLNRNNITMNIAHVFFIDGQ